MKEKFLIKTDNQPLTIFLIFILIIGLFGMSYFVYEIAITEMKKEEVVKKDYTLDIYKNDYSICGDKNNYCTEIAFTIETYSKDSKYIAVDNDDSFVLYDDNGLNIYNIKTGESKKIDLDNNYLNYEIYLNNKKDKVVGIIYSLDNYKVGYYNIPKKNKLYEGGYDSIEFLDENYLQGYSSELEYLYLLNTNNEKEELSFKNEEEVCGFSYQLHSYNDKYYFLEKNECDLPVVKKIYDNSKNIIFEGNLEDYKISLVGGFLYLNEKEVVKKYDISGNLLATNKDLGNIERLIDNYVVSIKDNVLNIFNFDTKEEIKIADWKDIYNFNHYESKYYTREYLDSIGEYEKLEGFYIFIEYNETDINGITGIEYYYNPNTKNVIETFIY